MQAMKSQPVDNPCVPLPHLRAWRIWLGVSAPELARRAGLHVSRVYTLETSQEPARLTTVARLALALGISRVALMHLTPDEAGLEEWARGQRPDARQRAAAS